MMMIILHFFASLPRAHSLPLPYLVFHSISDSAAQYIILWPKNECTRRRCCCFFHSALVMEFNKCQKWRPWNEHKSNKLMNRIKVAVVRYTVAAFIYRIFFRFALFLPSTHSSIREFAQPKCTIWCDLIDAVSYFHDMFRLHSRCCSFSPSPSLSQVTALCSMNAWETVSEYRLFKTP